MLLKYLCEFAKRAQLIIKGAIFLIRRMPLDSIVILYENTEFPNLTTFYSYGNNNNKPGMLVVGRFLVTNISKKVCY
jgi:hypothetical protein